MIHFVNVLCKLFLQCCTPPIKIICDWLQIFFFFHLSPLAGAFALHNFIHNQTNVYFKSKKDFLNISEMFDCWIKNVICNLFLT